MCNQSDAADAAWKPFVVDRLVADDRAIRAVRLDNPTKHLRIQDQFHPDGISYESGDEGSETETDSRSSQERSVANGSVSSVDSASRPAARKPTVTDPPNYANINVRPRCETDLLIAARSGASSSRQILFKNWNVRPFFVKTG